MNCDIVSHIGQNHHRQTNACMANQRMIEHEWGETLALSLYNRPPFIFPWWHDTLTTLSSKSPAKNGITPWCKVGLGSGPAEMLQYMSMSAENRQSNTFSQTGPLPGTPTPQFGPAGQLMSWPGGVGAHIGAPSLRWGPAGRSRAADQGPECPIGALTPRPEVGRQPATPGLDPEISGPVLSWEVWGREVLGAGRPTCVGVYGKKGLCGSRYQFCLDDPIYQVPNVGVYG